MAVFDVYSLYERGSGAKLSYGKCEGLWLGCWNGRTDSPVNITWSSAKVKVLGVFLGPGNLEVDNWRPRITAVENALNSWRQRSLSYKGKALVINALALSRVWYVASLIHVPRWVSVELNTLIFKFFWSGKRDLVARRVVVQPSCLGSFSVVDFQCKVMALHVPWVRRFISSPSSWVSLMVFWFSSRLAAPPHLVFSAPLCFSPDSLPPFYRSLLTAWRACKGSLTASSLGIGSGIDFCPVSAMSTKSAYLFLLSENAVSPHCEEKFFPLFGSLYWSGLVLGVSFSYFIWIVPLLIYVGKFHMGSFTRPRGLPVLVMFFLLPVFILLLSSLFNSCFFTVLWQSVSCRGFNLLCS